MESAFPINLCAMLFAICNIPMAFISFYCLQHFTISNVLRVACAMQITGVWMRYQGAVAENFTIVHIGTAFSACAVAFFINSISIIANIWFSDKQRALATAIATIAMPLGSLVTLILTGIQF